MRRYELTNEQFKKIENMLPGRGNLIQHGDLSEEISS
jgi:hypothetical protein